LSFAIVGGPTGVELAGTAEIARRTLRNEFRHIDPASAKVRLVEAIRACCLRSRKCC
jgi:NADH dehydrogenase